jgi:hypothetical protein
MFAKLQDIPHFAMRGPQRGFLKPKAEEAFRKLYREASHRQETSVALE